MPQQTEPTYRDAFIKSWQFILHHKLLWVLGAMATLVGQFGLGNFIGSLWSFITERQLTLLPLLPRTISWHALSALETWQFSSLLVILFALVAFLVVMATCAQGAVIAAAHQYFSARSTLTLSVAWHKGAHHFWRLLIVNVIQQSILLITLSAVLGFWEQFSHTSVLGVVMLIIGLGIGILIALITSVLSIYTAIRVIEKDATLSEAVADAYELLKDHLVVSIEISVLVVVVVIVPIAIIWLGAYVSIIPAIPLWWLGVFSHHPGLVMAGIFVAQLVFASVVALVGGGFNAFTISSWVYCYRMMDKKGLSSRLLKHGLKIATQEPKRRVRVMRGRVS